MRLREDLDVLPLLTIFILLVTLLGLGSGLGVEGCRYSRLILAELLVLGGPSPTLQRLP